MNQKQPPMNQMHAPSPLAQHKAEAFQLQAPGARLPGGFWRRLIAGILDSTICGILTMPVSFVFGVILGLVSAHSGADPQSNAPFVLFINVGSEVASLAVVFLYYGWFYSHKGATPGKMLLRLQVSYFDTGTYLTYWRTFARETVGKLLSALLLGIGFLMVALRRDKRGLHDLLLNTQVTYEP
jgi:uncharacterized RDD family membrane protein YckC